MKPSRHLGYSVFIFRSFFHFSSIDILNKIKPKTIYLYIISSILDRVDHRRQTMFIPQENMSLNIALYRRFRSTAWQTFQNIITFSRMYPKYQSLRIFIILLTNIRIIYIPVFKDHLQLIFIYAVIRVFKSIDLSIIYVSKL